VYAFDNLGPARFVELCALLLGSRYKGFPLSGPGADGGIDAENDALLAELRPEEPALLVKEIVVPRKLVIFQFKHMVAARVGQVNARRKLLDLYQSSSSRVSEVCKPEVKSRKPAGYVLVTNVEVNSKFRSRFAAICRNENPDIANYQVIGLDDLEEWVTMDRSLRAHYFPTIFGSPRFDLQIKLQTGFLTRILPDDSFIPTDKVLCVGVLNVGAARSYLSAIKFKILVDGEVKYALPSLPHPARPDPLGNPKFGEPVPPGKRQEFRYLFEMFWNLKSEAKGAFFLSDVMVWDEIDNVYSVSIPDAIRKEIFDSMKG
jgi:hypothetical protein